MIQDHYAPVVVNGVIYWLADFSTGSQAIASSFDVKTETFEVILPPEGFEYENRMRFFELDGCVGLSIVKCDNMVVTNMKVKSYPCVMSDWLRGFDGSLKLWVLEYYGNGVWKENHIRTNDPIPYYLSLEAYRDGKFLWWGAYEEYYCHDVKRKSLKAVNTRHDFGCPPFCSYEESLVSPAAIRLDSCLRSAYCLSDQSH